MTTFPSVLVAVDGSKNSFKAAEFAGYFARSSVTDRVILLCVSQVGAGSSAPRRVVEILDEAAGYVTSQGAREMQLTKKVREAPHSVVSAIVDEASESRSDLIVLGTRGLGGFKRLILGSVSTGVVTHARCSACVVRDSDVRIARILVAVDGSKPSGKAVLHAARLARELHAELVAACVVCVPYSTLVGDIPIPIDRVSEEMTQNAERSLSEATALAGREGVAAKREIVKDRRSEVDGLTKYAGSHDVDLIVVGTRGIGGFEKILLGSVAEGVLRYARCSVLVVR